MNKYKLLALMMATFLLSACGTKVEKKEVEETRIEPTATPIIKDMTWKDAAGFVFKYPEDIKIVANMVDDESYSNLESSDGVKVKAVDSKYRTIEEWVLKDSTVKTVTLLTPHFQTRKVKK